MGTHLEPLRILDTRINSFLFGFLRHGEDFRSLSLSKKSVALFGIGLTRMPRPLEASYRRYTTSSIRCYGNAFDVPLDDSLDFAGLVLLRDIHEPAHVKKANRPRRAEPLEPDSSAALAASSSNGTGTIIEGETRKRRTLMNEIARDLHGVLRHAEALSSGPGTARLSRWMEKDTGVKTGNALNAELSAGQQANKV
jgi:hypothetical protein